MSDRGRTIAAAPVEGTLMAANWSSHGEREMSARKRDIRRLADASAPARRSWLARGAFFHDEDLLYLKFLIPEGARVLELGCGTGDLAAGAIRRHRGGRHPRRARGLPGHVREPARAMHARDPPRGRLFLAPLVSGAEAGRGDGAEDAAACAKRARAR